MRITNRSGARLACVLALLFLGPATLSAEARASRKPITTLAPLPADADSFAVAINDRGFVVGHSSSADGGAGTTSTAVMWDREGTPHALPPLDGDQESFAVAINNEGMIVGTSRNNDEACARDTAVMWTSDGTVAPLLPLAGDRQSVANGLNDAGVVAGTSKSEALDPANSCDSLFTPVVWDMEPNPTALAPLAGFPEGYASTVTSTGDVIGGSVNVTTGFDFQGTVWRSRAHRASMLHGPAGSFVNTPANGNADGAVVGDSYDFTFTSSAVVWDPDGTASLLPPLRRGIASMGRAMNEHGRAAGFSMGAEGNTAVAWNRNGKPTPLRPLEGDAQSEAMGINRSGHVVGRSFGAGMSTAVIWRTR